MTPLKLFLLNIVLIIFFGILTDFYEDEKVKNFFYSLIGLIFFSLVGSIIWGIFYYIKF